MIMVATWVMLIFSLGQNDPTAIYFYNAASCNDAKIVLERMPQVKKAECLPLGDAG